MTDLDLNKTESATEQNNQILLKNRALQEQNEQLKAQLERIKCENQALCARKSQLESENNTLKGEKALGKGASEQKIVERYNSELKRLALFVDSWQKALPEPKERTPESKKRLALAMALAEILKDKPCVSTIEEGVELLDKLNGVIYGKPQGESGFNLEEVLNPGNDLDLESLCKELGVMD